MITEAQRQERINYLGGSEAAAVLGLSRWKTPLQVWAEKTGNLEPEDISQKLNVKLGIALEDTVANLFMEETGKKVRRNNRTLVHPKYDFIRANLDREVVGEDAILECKTASAYMSKEWEDKIPPEYVIQCYHYLAVTGKAKCYIAVLIGNNKFLWQEILRDETIINNLIDKEVHFWNEFILTKIMPSTISCNDSDTLYKLFPVATEEQKIILSTQEEAEIELLEALKKDMRSLEAKIEQKENSIKALLKDCETGLTARYTVTWKNQSRSSIDTKKLKECYPDIANALTKESQSRVLRIKLNKEVTL